MAAPTERRHVALLPVPLASHPAMMLLLGRKIISSVPNVEVSLLVTDPSATSLSAAAADSGIRVVRVDSGVDKAVAVTPPQALRKFAEVAVESLRKGLAVAEEEVGFKITCIVADAMMTFVCRVLAEERGVKWAALWSPSAGALAAHMHTEHFLNAIGPHGIEGHKEETADQYIPEFPSIPIIDLPPEIFNVGSPFGKMLHLMSLYLDNAVAVVVNSYDALEPAATDILRRVFSDKLPVLNAGPFTLTMPSSSETSGADPHNCLPWLDSHAAAPTSFVYISFGSEYSPPLEELVSLAEALEATKVPFLWSLPNRFKPSLPEGFTERTSTLGKVVPWAPQMSVLSHVAVGAQLTHCGWNSVLESIVTGVPIIGRPSRIADHPFDGRLVFDVWGIGVEVEGWKLTKATAMAALEKVMRGEEGKKAREKIQVMKRLSNEATTEPNGSSAKNLREFINIITC
uniref:2-hydroxyflavanone C-glucosyltransferase n=1 Tax=Fagopyrum esculentum TaxID=3617 RepID=A0A0A1H9W6_FAGES|nr:UDP-glycose: glycosyltransferase UGT714A1 [Fagopyrum esculentum]